MRTLRQRFVLSTALLVALQLAASALVVVSWAFVLASMRREQELVESRAEVSALGAAIREQYVHQAHTFVEGGPGHLDHQSEADHAVERHVARVLALPLDDADRALAEDVALRQAAMTAWFREEVAPVARAGALDRVTATRLHATTERLTAAATRSAEQLSTRLDARQALERQEVRRATGAAMAATGGLTLGAVLLAASVARGLARAVLVPVDALRRAAAAWDPQLRAGRDELGEISVAFDHIVARLTAAEERRVEAERLAALGEMSAAVAHELMNPLAVILGHARPGDPVHEEAEHARRIITGLLGFARPSEEAKGEVDLGVAVSEAVDRLVGRAELRGVDLELRATPGATVLGSPGAVRQVLDNLLANALEASPEGGRIEVEVSRGSVRVLDRGHGIPAAVRERLYEPFVTGRAEGTGLGLAVSQRIARGLGGGLVHEDRQGGGTVVTWDLGGPRG